MQGTVLGSPLRGLGLQWEWLLTRLGQINPRSTPGLSELFPWKRSVNLDRSAENRGK